MTRTDPRIVEAVRRQVDVQFHDVDTALQLGDWNGVVGEDGEVDPGALLAAFDQLVTERPYVVKGGYGPPTQPSGQTVGSGRRRTRVVHDEDYLRAKYPGL